MYLKSIEIQGFKSFANRTIMEFHDGITGIVGPNGSGKSNVADAVRWVFGEQKVKQLRSNKMEDVIFAGTEKRKPLGFAYVCLTLDNSDHSLPVDYNEVSVSRRLFRSGESEYRLNGSQCRLKDINEIFDDTGIGTEGYSIIGQGQIDKVLSGKPEERRELFDEAAGIVKFKRRKIITQRKLENEHQNLLRVEDILKELERQVKPLERQAENAKKYLKLRDELKRNDIDLFCIDMKQVLEQREEIEKNTKIAKDEMQEVSTKLEQIRKEYEELDAFLVSLEEKISTKQEELQNQILEKNNCLHQIELINEQIRSVKSNDAFVQNRILEINESIINTKKQISETQTEQLLLKESIADNGKKEESYSSSLYDLLEELKELRELLEEKKQDVIHALNEKAEMAKRLQHFDTLLEQTALRREQIDKQILLTESEEGQYEQETKHLEQELTKTRQKLQAQKQSIEVSELEYKEKGQALQRIEQERSQAQMGYQQVKARLESLENMAERYEGYGNSIQKVMELKDKKKGIIGVVADIIQTEKKYETAIETALGGSIQNIVTDLASTAKSIIEYLKNNRYGRATFIPIENLNNKTGFTNEAVLKEPGVIGLCSELVQVKKEYEAVAKYLLGRIVVVDTIDTGIFINRKYKQTLRIVTLDGELFSPGGSMTGGAFRNKSNLLGRRREIQELSGKLDEIKQTISSLKQKEENQRNERMQQFAEIEKKKEVYQEYLLLINSLKVSLEKELDHKQRVSSAKEQLKVEALEMEQNVKEIENNNNALRLLMDENKEKNLDVEEETRQLSSLILEKEEEEEKLRELYNQLQQEAVSNKERLGFLTQNLSRLNDEISAYESERASLEGTKGSTTGEIQEKQLQIHQYQEEQVSVEKKINQLQQELEQYINSKEEKSRKHKGFFEKREIITDQKAQLDRELFRLSAQSEKAEEQREQLLNYMWAEYELGYSQAKTLFSNQVESRAKLKKQIAVLKADIRSLGDVNVNAIESYKEVSERYEFLKKQHADLIAAEKDLEKIVAELEQGMRRQFQEQFSQIQTEFDRVFKEMFGGGHGLIELSDDDVLDATITITAQPPGKKLQNMMQLSGGEKALTAIALLFAFQSLKPSPFCLLDEIEAALDGSNVVRFAQYLHKLTDHTQFIVITHRRGTMGCADQLYGITMQEKGVTSLVSVDLLENQLDKN